MMSDPQASAYPPDDDMLIVQTMIRLPHYLLYNNSSRMMTELQMLVDSHDDQLRVAPLYIFYLSASSHDANFNIL